MKSKKFNLKKEFNKSLNYIKESKNFIYIVIGIFFFFAFIGFFIPTPDSISEQLLKFIQELMEKTAGMNQWELIQYIFLNNLQSSFFGLVLGVFFGIFPIITTIVNGYILGFVSIKVVSVEGIFVLWRLFPHGIFELPAVFISLGLGLKFGSFIFQKKKFDSLKDYFVNSLRVFFFIVFPLLVIAAIIEGSLIALFG
ncbi:MAG TPA: stage II sporulation protein M [Nanoarchaeota archaeon]|nr:stage II sporulation protein M [Nanoarchaeota archaeon]HIH63926.1 stage II sporulation protein M [Nanoarchaeota archaeon]HIJ09732.1 stage II sporulation protein M [Nanoarchaeota archaeon]